MRNCHICHICGGAMHPQIESLEYKFDGISVTVNNVCVFRCSNCEESILESAEAKRIENIVLIKSGKKNEK